MHKYPKAPYAYLNITNFEEQRHKFLNGEIENPHFIYGKSFNQHHLKRRLEDIEKDLQSILSGHMLDHLQKRQKQTAFLLAAHALQTDTKQLKNFRKQVKALYGAPRKSFVQQILLILEQAAGDHPKKKELLKYIEDGIELHGNPANDQRPTTKVFRHYRYLFRDFAPWLFKRELCPETRDIKELFNHALRQIGADKIGWRTKTKHGLTNVRVSLHSKHVEIGDHLRVRTRKRRLQVVCHEIYGHINRNSSRLIPITNIEDSEGFAVFLEQLLEPHFSTKRSLRYLAVAAGWGTLGRPMNFRETYEIIWRAMVILSSYTEKIAKSKAFQECLRAFRSGRPDLPGAVFTKDIAYFEGNMKVWEKLEKRILDAEEFALLLKGKELLEKE